MERIVKFYVTIEGKLNQSRISIEQNEMLFEKYDNLFDTDEMTERFLLNLKLLKNGFDSITFDLYIQNENDYSNRGREIVESYRIIDRYNECRGSFYSKRNEKFDFDDLNFDILDKKQVIKKAKEIIKGFVRRGNLKFVSLKSELVAV